ncbi:MAG: DUF4124 domain-containing protein [Tahibacter sp.]
MPRHLLLRVFASSLVLLAAQTAQAEKKIYKWKDAAGVVHFSASPPPVGVQGATEVNVAGKAAPNDPAVDPAKAAAATELGKTDPSKPPADPKEAPPPPPKTAEQLEQARIEEAALQKAEECRVKRESLVAANRRMHGESNEILTPQERIDLPKLTQRLENEIRANCAQ